MRLAAHPETSVMIGLSISPTISPSENTGPGSEIGNDVKTTCHLIRFACLKFRNYYILQNRQSYYNCFLFTYNSYT